jgi:hypothetical protein
MCLKNLVGHREKFGTPCVAHHSCERKLDKSNNGRVPCFCNLPDIMMVIWVGQKTRDEICIWDFGVKI